MTQKDFSKLKVGDLVYTKGKVGKIVEKRLTLARVEYPSKRKAWKRPRQLQLRNHKENIS